MLKKKKFVKKKEKDGGNGSDFVTKTWQKHCFAPDLSDKSLKDMKSKGNARVGMSGSGIFRKGDIPYYVDNLFYESFGMSCDEVLETLKKSDFFEHE